MSATHQAMLMLSGDGHLANYVIAQATCQTVAMTSIANSSTVLTPIEGLYAGNITPSISTLGTTYATNTGSLITTADAIIGSASARIGQGASGESPAISGYALHLNASTNSRDIAHADNLRQFFPERIGCIEITIKPYNLPLSGGVYSYIISCGKPQNTAAAGSYSWSLRIQDNESLQFEWYDGSSSHYLTSTALTMANNTVYKIAIDFDATQVRMYVDGTLNNTSSSTAAFYQVTTTAAQMYVGSLNYYGSFGARMAAANIRVTSGASRYSGSTYTPATTPYDPI